MTLTSIGTLGTSSSAFYQSVSGGAQSSTLTSIWSPSASAADSDTPQPEQDTLQVRRSDDELFHRIETAVSGALNSAQQDATADPNQIIQDAVVQAFQTSTADTAASPSTNTNSSGAGGTSSSDVAGQSDPDTSTATQGFLQALRSYGVDPQQFHGDLLSAVKDAQQGNVDPSTVFRHFPVGSSLDAVA